MKKFNLSTLFLSAAMISTLSSCSSDDNGPIDNNDDISEELPFLFNGTDIGNGDQEFEIKGKYTLPKGTYNLKGWCYITEGSELTIEPGTIIKGDKETKASLIVEPGGKLYAQGTAKAPIVFTSEAAPGERRPGDWGGLIICGNAVNNKVKQQIEGGPRTEHGGTNNDDNSGILSYVRVEFAGFPFKTDQEINGITFGSVGRKTQIDHVQVSYSNDDSFEWFGGCVDAKYLVAYHGWDDDFDTDNGFSGKLQYLLAVRNPKIADTSLSNGFESDNNSTAGTENPYTSCVFSNVTIVGPYGQDANFVNNSDYINAGEMNPQNGSKSGVFQSAMQVRRNSHLSCFNSVAIGYPVGLMIENDKGGKGQTAALDGELVMKGLVFAEMDIIGSDVNKTWKDIYSVDAGTTYDETQVSFSHQFFLNQGNRYFESISDLKFKQPNSLEANMNFGPMSGSPLLSGADFSHNKLDGFDKVSYIGAFSSENDTWMESWTNFDPQNTAY